MLQGINKIGRSWLGKAIVAVLFGFLIVSFAIWGIGDIFRGSVRDDRGDGRQDASISAEAFRTAYQNELQRLMRQTAPEHHARAARALSASTAQILSRLVTEAALDQRAQELGLSVSDQLVARTITQDPNFRGPNGQFDRAAFDEILRSNGLSEAGVRARAARRHHAPATRRRHRRRASRAARRARGDPPLRRRAPRGGLRPAVGRRLRARSRLRPRSSSKAFFEERKAAFRAPEYRAVNVAGRRVPRRWRSRSKSPTRMRGSATSSVKASRYGTPERRTIQQIVFPSAEEAEAAFKRIKDGTAFEAIAAERNVDPKSLELGTFSKDRDASTRPWRTPPSPSPRAPSSGPVQGRFGPVLVRVTKIEPESVKPFEEVAADVKREVALERGAQRPSTMSTTRSRICAPGARPLADIAKEKEPAARLRPGDRSHRPRQGRQSGRRPCPSAMRCSPLRSPLISASTTRPLRTRAGGYVWYDVTGIDPARDKTLRRGPRRGRRAMAERARLRGA